MSVVEIYTDGACEGNPGRGGWAAILRYGSHEKQLFGHEDDTTNQRMELLAALKGLEALRKPCRVKLYSDSAYLVNAFNNGWLEKWKRNGWKNAKGKPVANITLWEVLEEAASAHSVEWIKVDGHAGNEGNNLADGLAYFIARAGQGREDSE